MLPHYLLATGYYDMNLVSRYMVAYISYPGPDDRV